ncbi:MAG: hypothetical protein LAT51_05330 [Flavobacteriaceae bacterium]|nr:hypothetical protein [Flavobacteriaceae bacterium]
MKMLKKIVFFLLIALIGIFVFQNLSSVNINFLTWELKITKSILIIVIYVLGMLSGGILFSILKRLWSSEDK